MQSSPETVQISDKGGVCCYTISSTTIEIFKITLKKLVTNKIKTLGFRSSRSDVVLL
jgi:hypothetical protein